eukprot:3637081-Amphidinium_carterae.1
MEHELKDESQGVEVNKLGLFREVELTSSTVQHETLQAKGHIMVKPSEVLSSTGTEREKCKQAASKELSSILEKALRPATESDWRDAHDTRIEIVPLMALWSRKQPLKEEKNRLVVLGNQVQQFSTTSVAELDTNTFRCLLAWAALHQATISIIDVSTAFLYAKHPSSRKILT